MFVLLTKEKNCAHVLLATSDATFHRFLLERMGESYFEAVQLDNFCEADARQFYVSISEKAHPCILSAASDDALWKQVYAVCGGNAGALNSFAARLSRLGSADVAVSRFSINARAVVLMGLSPPPYAGWTEHDYAVVARALLIAPNHQVSGRELAALLPAGDCEAEAVLSALLAANLVGMLLCPPMGVRTMGTRTEAAGPIFVPFAASHVAVWRVTPQLAQV